MRTVVDPLMRAEAMHGPRTAVVCGDVRRTFAEVTDRCHRLAGVLDDLGLESGARVAILAANSAEYAEIYATVPAAGRSVVPLNTRWADPELLYALDDGERRRRHLCPDSRARPRLAAAPRRLRRRAGTRKKLSPRASTAR